MIVRDTDFLYFVALNIDEVIRNRLNPQRVEERERERERERESASIGNK